MYTYLAIGDSYTIGEQCDLKDNFPNQLQQQLNAKHNLDIDSPQIIATTGWTTGELIEGIKNHFLQPKYDLVTLLIGVNNQYRNMDIEIFKTEFTYLLELAIKHAQNAEKGVFVLSIPDWGVTPFARDKDSIAIAEAINEYNTIKQKITVDYGCDYTDITESTRINGVDESYLAEDKLHYNAAEYKIWADMLCDKAAKVFLDIMHY